MKLKQLHELVSAIEGRLMEKKNSQKQKISQMCIWKSCGSEKESKQPEWNVESQFFLLGFTPCKVEEPLRGVELQQKEKKRLKTNMKAV